jgi:hypothetical protein
MSLKKITGIAILIAIAVLIALITYSRSNPIETIQLTENNLKPVLSGSTEQGDVAIELQPVENNNGNIRVRISANTHSVDLSQFDLKKITVMQIKDMAITPLSAPELSGHHSSGELVFNVDGDAEEFTIVINGIPKTEQRIFRWP